MRKFFRYIYDNLIGIDDSPMRIAAGFGLGVFMGIFPGVGPIASVFVAAFLHVNKAAALTGCLLTNTWIGFLVFVSSAQVGCWLTGRNWQVVTDAAQSLLREFHWNKLWELSFNDVVWPLLAGYAVMGLLCGVAAGLTVWVVLVIYKRSKNHEVRRL